MTVDRHQIDFKTLGSQAAANLLGEVSCLIWNIPFSVNEPTVSSEMIDEVRVVFSSSSSRDTFELKRDSNDTRAEISNSCTSLACNNLSRTHRRSYRIYVAQKFREDIPLTDQVRGPYCKLRTEFFPVDLWAVRDAVGP